MRVHQYKKLHFSVLTTISICLFFESGLFPVKHFDLQSSKVVSSAMEEGLPFQVVVTTCCPKVRQRLLRWCCAVKEAFGQPLVLGASVGAGARRTSSRERSGGAVGTCKLVPGTSVGAFPAFSMS